MNLFVRSFLLHTVEVVDDWGRRYWLSCEIENLISVLLPLRRSGTLTETVLELPGEGLQVSATGSTGGASADGLLGPLVRSRLSTRVAALTAALLLQVPSTGATTDA